MEELEQAKKDYKDKFGELPPMMFLRGMTPAEQVSAINERIADGKDFGEHANEEDELS
ncbi:hypothetical protein AAA453_03460 [Staphylococcus sp. Mo2-6]|uniref:hypothetical protein n=1 Tax=Staphylococcus sp. Mo2-6 TaxID=3135641 RepID=UPI003366B85C